MLVTQLFRFIRLTFRVYQVQDGIIKSSSSALATAKEELKDWEAELASLRILGKLASRRDELSTKEVSALQAQLKEKESELPDATKKANEVSC